MFEYAYLIEILTPKKTSPDDDAEKMKLFSERYRRILDLRCGMSIPDNPMGRPRYSALETIEICNLPVVHERTVMNLNTFHSKEDLDGVLKTASKRGLKYLLIIRGDGGPALPKLNPESVGAAGEHFSSQCQIQIGIAFVRDRHHFCKCRRSKEAQSVTNIENCWKIMLK